MLKQITILFAITLLPFFELRASIPYGILDVEIVLPFGMTLQGLGMIWYLVFIICVISNLVLVPFLWFFVNNIMHIFLRIKIINKLYQKWVARTQRKVHPYVEKYGTLGLAIFIGIPLPGSGVYSGALGAYLLGFKFKDYLIASIIGVLIAGIIMTIVSLFFSGLLVYT